MYCIVYLTVKALVQVKFIFCLLWLRLIQVCLEKFSSSSHFSDLPKGLIGGLHTLHHAFFCWNDTAVLFVHVHLLVNVDARSLDGL